MTTLVDKAPANRFRFRAWDKSNLEMFEVRELKFHSSVSNPYTVFGIYGDGSDAEDVILMQSTGLTDKSGKEIFEGDVVRFTWANPMTYVGVVTFKQAQFFIQPADDNPPGDEYDTLHDERRIEIIGNIYENPELLPTS